MADNLDTVKTYIRFLLAQCAAESYLDGLGKLEGFEAKDVKANFFKSSTLIGRLALGANHHNFGFELKKYRESKKTAKNGQPPCPPKRC